MGFKIVILVLIILICMVSQGMTQDTSNASPIAEDLQKSFQNEDLFNISPSTGMSPIATSDLVKIPIVGARGFAFIGGSWLLNLRDMTSATMRLNLNQYQDAVFGSGDVTKGGVVTNVSTGGTIIGNRLNLYVMTEGNNNLYRMSLTIAPGSMNGNYLFTAPGTTQPGIVYGSLTALAKGNSAQTGAPA